MKMIKKTLVFIISVLFSVTGASQKVDMSLFSGIRPRNIGPGGMSGRVTAFAVDPRNTNVFYIGTASGGLWKTSNAGTTFEPVFDDEDVASIGALAIDPLRPDIIWAGTGEGNPRNSVTGGYGIYKSLDGGKTWKCMGLELSRYIHRIIIDPINPDIVYAGAIGNPWAPHKERGLYRTRDGGKTWEQILFTGETSGVADMAMDPSNPGKIFVAMWDHRRWPWFFTSSATGSGLWVTRNGGDTFTRVKEGLPPVMGRIGLAIAASNPDYVYAYVESKPSAIYRSTDGGQTWEKRGEKGIGNRPFYYAEIYTDPKNENRLYTLYSNVAVSEDGGLTFSGSITESVHLDHHAWWIDPINPDRMLDGNDGGMAISYDKGKTWRHIENLPVGQFYHINVDNEIPYNIYGGLQDNGSWRGPAYAWYNGPLINEMYDFMLGGDGFDAMPVAGDPRYCYAQSQGGALRYYDLLTGWDNNIRPAPEKNEKLRFNWNAALAQDPFENNTIYFGSQFVHKSTDRGQTWTKISHDLTTNDPEKLKQDTSGGITIDATGAENHCTIVTIAPSPVRQGVIWAGTDDGKIQVTTDGGTTWQNTATNIKGMPKNSWVPQITASHYDAGAAFAVVNDYRQGDNSAYLYKTDDYGKSWKRIIDDTDVWGYLLCFVQDPVERRLMFAGTEYGLYVSFDEGGTWNKWTGGYPTVSTYDMVIQPRESDLVIGTFGRGVWIIDDIRPLRAIAVKDNKLLSEKLVLFEIPDGVAAETKNLPGYYFYGDAMFRGENRLPGSMISFYSSDDSIKVNIDIADENGKLVRSTSVDVHRGLNRFNWMYDLNPLPRAELPGSPEERPRYFRSFGGFAIPGKYKVTLSSGDEKSEAYLLFRSDPRMPKQDYSFATQNRQRAEDIGARVKELNKLLAKYNEAKVMAAKYEGLASSMPAFASHISNAQVSVKEAIAGTDRALNQRDDGLLQKVNGYMVLVMTTSRMTQDEERRVSDAEAALAETFRLIDDFFSKTWSEYTSILEKYTLTGEKAELK